MKRQTNTLLLSVAAMTAAMAISSTAARAQYRVGNDGRALDANNRLGSGGFNGDPGTSRAPRVTGNQIVTGNVTGGKEFRGNVGYTDPKAFRGQTADEGVDRFIRGSSGAPVGGMPQNNAENVTAFYGSSRAAPPPPGFERQAFTGAYVPGPAPTRTDSDLRLGSVIATPQTLLPPPGDLLLPGPVDPDAGRTLITASPLYGVRQWRADVADQQQFVDRFSSDPRTINADGQTLDRKTLDAYRSELLEDADPNAPTGDALQSGNLNPPRTTDGNGGGLMTGAIDNAAVGNNALGGRLSTAQGTRQELMSPIKQSALYARLQKQFEAEGNPANDQEAARRFALQRKAADAGNTDAAAGKPTKDATAGTTDGKTDDDTAQMPVEKDATADVPLKVDNLAEGMQAKGLAKLMNDAEANMRQGKFGAAIDLYDAAARVAPNNPLVTLGRAHAELGASYYGRAETDLRRAFADGPALLQGQYDLVSFFGEERLAFLIKDLKEIASNEPTQSGPTFLLAYIARNMGNNDRARDYLAETEKRLGGPDEQITTIRRAWRLGEAEPTK